MHLPLDKILTDVTLYPSEAPDRAARLTRYAEALRAGEALPAVTVGKTRGGYVLIDGRLPLEAHRLAEQRKVAAVVTPVPRKHWRAESFRLNAHRLARPLPDAPPLERARRKIAQAFDGGTLEKTPGMPQEALEAGVLDCAVHPPIGPGARLVKTPLVSLPEEKGKRAERAPKR